MYGLTHFLLAIFPHARDTIYVAFPVLENRRKIHSYKAENLSKIMVLKGLKKMIADKAEIKTVGLRTYYKKDRSPQLSYSTGYD